MRKLRLTIWQLLLLGLVFIAISAPFYIGNLSRDTAIPGKSIDVVNINRCSRLPDLSSKCFDMSGKIYIVELKNTIKVCEKLQSIVTAKNLTADKEAMPMPCDELNKSISARSNDVKDPTSYAGNMLSINFSGGLFGVDKLPHSTDGHALYTSTYTYSNDSSESDNIYIIKSEFGVNDDHAAKVLNAAKKLPKNEYLLLVAER